MSDMRLPVSEIFGPTLQGEGVHSGRRAVFVRFAGCDSRCEWCDTAYAKTTEECEMMTVAEILQAIEKSKCGLVVLTGGNPCIQNLSLLVSKLKASRREIHVETQGTLCPDWLKLVDLVTVCPKIHSPHDRERANEFILRLQGKVPIQLKYVVFTDEDFHEAKLLAIRFSRHVMVIQPGWDPKTDTYPYGFRALAEKVAKHAPHDHMRFMPQLHRLIWGSLRGV